ncbi:ABC transporter permease [Acidobacteriota bacterium]
MNRPRPAAPRLADWLLRLILEAEEYTERSGDLEEVYVSVWKNKGKSRADLWFWFQVLKSLPSFLRNRIYWRTVMLRNYIKIALRHLKKHKAYSFINLAGLTIGMTCFILIFLWVRNEVGFDQFHLNKDRLYRVMNKFPDGTCVSSHTYALTPYMKDTYAEVEEIARVWPWHKSLVKYGDKKFEESDIYLTEPGFFKMFSFPFIKGSPETALPDKNSVVLTEEAARRYFGDEDPLGKVLYFGEPGEDFKVTGVIADVPSNSHFQFNIVSHVDWLGLDRLSRWSEWVSHAYVLLHPSATEESVNSKIVGIYREKVDPEETVVPVIQPMSKVHLYENGNSGSITKIYIFSIIAFFILVMACVNFMNLSTARSAQRAREVGMRKVIGATRSQVVKQFLGEAVLLSFLSLALALICVLAVLPAFNSFTNQSLVLFSGDNIPVFLILILTAVITGFVSGSYPAVVLSSFQPVQSLKNRLIRKQRGSSFRKVLIVFQFSISVGLILSTLIVSKQLRYIQNKDLGSNRENVVTLYNNPDLEKRFKVFKEELRRETGILNITSAAQRPMQVGQMVPMNWEGNPNEEPESWGYTMADFDFFETFDMEIVQGRSFSEKYPTDVQNACVINESAARRMGLDNPIGANIYFGHMALDEKWRNVQVVGVVKDFHSRSLYSAIGPFLFRIYRPFFRLVFIKVLGTQIPEALRNIEAVFTKYSPGYPFGYEFVDDAFNRQYAGDMELKRLFNLFSVLSIVIACLGLFGLASFTVEQKTKEVGIRKVLGASVFGIVGLTTKEFLKWIILANLVAWPIGYFLMKRWMNNFVYRTEIGLLVFVLASGLTLLIAFMTILYQTLRAAWANPVDSLRYE